MARQKASTHRDPSRCRPANGSVQSCGHGRLGLLFVRTYVCRRLIRRRRPRVGGATIGRLDAAPAPTRPLRRRPAPQVADGDGESIIWVSDVIAGQSPFRPRGVGGEAQTRRHAAVCRPARGCIGFGVVDEHPVRSMRSEFGSLRSRSHGRPAYFNDFRDPDRSSEAGSGHGRSPAVDCPSPPIIPVPSLRNGSDAYGLSVGVSRSWLPRRHPDSL